MKNNKRSKPVQAVLVLCVRKQPQGDEKEVLLGLKTSGPIAGYVVAVGGHVNDSDAGYISAGHRETSEESSLIPDSSQKVAELRIWIKEKKLRMVVHVTRCTQWSGRLKNKSREFGWLRFIPFSEIPWDQTPPSDEAWMKRVLLDDKHCIISIKCGKDRTDVQSVALRNTKKF